jgi:hypothetical protein
MTDADEPTGAWTPGDDTGFTTPVDPPTDGAPVEPPPDDATQIVPGVGGAAGAAASGEPTPPAGIYVPPPDPNATDYGGPNEPIDTAPPPPPSGGGNGPLIAVIVLLVLIIGVGALLFIT